MIQALLLHQVIRRGPVAMTVEQCANDPAAQHSRKCFLIGFRVEGCDDFIAAREAANVQTFLVRWTTAKASHAWRVSFLETLFAHLFRTKLKFEL